MVWYLESQEAACYWIRFSQSDNWAIHKTWRTHKDIATILPAYTQTHIIHIKHMLGMHAQTTGHKQQFVHAHLHTRKHCISHANSFFLMLFPSCEIISSPSEQFIFTDVVRRLNFKESQRAWTNLHLFIRWYFIHTLTQNYWLSVQYRYKKYKYLKNK